MIIKTTMLIHEQEEVTIDPSSSGITVGSLVDKRICEYMDNMERVITHKRNPAEEDEKDLTFIDRIQTVCVEFDEIDHKTIRHQEQEGL